MKLDELCAAYLEILDVTEKEALENAKHIIRTVIAEDDTGRVLSAEALVPVVRVIEYTKNAEKTEKEGKHFEEQNEVSEWTEGNDRVQEGIMLPYLSESPDIEGKEEYLAFAELSGFSNDMGKPAILLSRITKITDFSS